MTQDFYRAFEDRHRGARETIKARQQVYLPFVTPVAREYPRAAALDLGCGRGEWLELLADQGITCSMSRRGECWDNAAMESFFSTLKIERVFRSRYKTRDDARADIFDYIERFYNPRRRHSTLNGLSPVEFEKRYASLTVCP